MSQKVHYLYQIAKMSVCMYVCTSVSIFEVTQNQSKNQNNQNVLIKWLGGLVGRLSGDQGG